MTSEEGFVFNDLDLYWNESERFLQLSKPASQEIASPLFFGGFLFSGFRLKQESAFFTIDGDIMADWWLYICEKKGHYYVGITTNIEKRLKQHGSPELLYNEGPFEKHAAASRERQLKKWTRIKKERLIHKGQES